jgi:hypothetical protein
MPRQNTPCNENAQLWYFRNALQKIKNTKDPVKRQLLIKALNKYTNGNAKSFIN